MKTILWVSPRIPLPESDGARVATAQLLRALRKSAPELKIHLLCIVNETVSSENVKKIECELTPASVTILERGGPRAGMSLIRKCLYFGKCLITQARTPLTIASFTAPTLQTRFKEIVEELIPDAILYDGLHAAGVIESGGSLELPKPFPPILYRAHNVETDIWASTAKGRSILVRLFLNHQKKKMETFERALIGVSRFVFPVSEEDDIRFQTSFQLKSESSRIIRIGQPFGKKNSTTTQSGTTDTAPTRVVFGFIGKLDWPPNREGILWFLKKVWPKLSATHPEWRLLIAGANTHLIRNSLTSLPESVQLLGYVKESSNFYAQVNAVIVPIFSGSGTRVKVIEASRFGKPCIGSELGVQGTGLMAFEGTAFLRAETEGDWVRVSESLNTRLLERMGHEAWNILRLQFDAAAPGDALAKALRELNSSGTD